MCRDCEKLLERIKPEELLRSDDEETRQFLKDVTDWETKQFLEDVTDWEKRSSEKNFIVGKK